MRAAWYEREGPAREVLAAGTEGPFPVAARFPLDGIVAAHELVESLDKLGTVVVEP